jgi:hypothetical protein
MDPGAHDGTSLYANIHNGVHLSGRGRGGKPDCCPGYIYASKEHQRSTNRAPAEPVRSCALPGNSAQAVSSAQAASRPARAFDLPAAARTGSVHALTGIKPAWLQPSFTFTLADPRNFPATNQPATNFPATNQPATNQPATNQPATNQPATNFPATNQPAANQPATNQPATNQPATNQPATNQPATNQPATNQPATNSDANSDANVSVFTDAPASARARRCRHL